MRPVAIFRFSPTEGPGYFADWLHRRGVASTVVPLDQGAAVPSGLHAFAGIGMMGGPASVNDDDPWIESMCSLLRQAVAERVPVMGHCFGGQLLAKALGAPVTCAPVAEIGWVDVQSTDAAARSAWFGGREHFTTFQWHYENFALPPGAVRVLTNRFNPNQAYVIDDRHVGLQCHIEMTSELVSTWVESDADRLPAVSGDSTQSAAEMRRDLSARIAALHAVADDVYARWATKLPV
jgi:GMP synthase-like glutamine amidotransferase